MGSIWILDPNNCGLQAPVPERSPQFALIVHLSPGLSRHEEETGGPYAQPVARLRVVGPNDRTASAAVLCVASGCFRQGPEAAGAAGLRRERNRSRGTGPVLAKCTK